MDEAMAGAEDATRVAERLCHTLSIN
eukprot:SAG11_NODE_12249_length_713_cov_1.162866_1_plen_25_part_01